MHPFGMAADDEPGTDGHQGDATAERQQINSIGNTETDHFLESRHNQGNHDHVGEVVLEAFKTVDGQTGVTLVKNALKSNQMRV